MGAGGLSTGLLVIAGAVFVAAVYEQAPVIGVPLLILVVLVMFERYMKTEGKV